MKRILLAAVALLLVFAVPSCTKEEQSLQKTKWVFETAEEKEELSFLNKTDVRLTNYSNGSDITIDGTYTYSAPTVTLRFLGTEYDGVVDGNKLHLTDPEDGEVRVYVKQ